MGTKDLFSNKDSYISRKQMRESYRSDPAFQKKVLGNPRIAKILNQSGGQKKVHDLFLEKARDGKVDLSDMEEIARRLEQGKVGGISSTKGHLVAKEFLSGSLRKFASEKTSDPVIESRYKSERTKIASPTGQATKLPPAFFANRVKSLRASTDSGKTEKKPGFFDSMKSVSQKKS